MAMFNDKHHHPLRLAVVPWRNDRPVFGTDNFAAIIIIMIIMTCELDMICKIIILEDKFFCCLWPLFSTKIKSIIHKENSRYIDISLLALKWLRNIQKRIIISWSNCSFPAFISEVDTNHIIIISSDYFPQYKRNDHLHRNTCEHVGICGNIPTRSQTQ